MPRSSSCCLDHHVGDDLRGVAFFDPFAHQVFAACPLGGIGWQRLVGARQVFFERGARNAGLDEHHADAEAANLMIERFRIAFDGVLSRGVEGVERGRDSTGKAVITRQLRRKLLVMARSFL